MAIATNPLTYNDYANQVANMAVVTVSEVSGVVVGDDAWETLVPQMLNYAELRIQRDLDLLPSQTANDYALTEGNNILTIPTEDFVTLQTLSVQSDDTNLVPLLPVTKEYIQNVYGDSSYTSTPQFFAMLGGDSATGGLTSNRIIVGPYPDEAYPVSVTGTIRLPSLYKFANTDDASTETTFISTWLPDLLIQASLIYISQYQRNFGAAANDPQMGPTYELQYQNLLKGALVEEARKKFQAGAWSSMSPAFVATVGR